MNTLGSVNAEEELRYASQILPTTDEVRMAVTYLTGCPSDKMYAFTMDREELLRFAKLAEEHLVYRLEKKPKTLDFYHEVAAL